MAFRVRDRREGAAGVVDAGFTVRALDLSERPGSDAEVLDAALAALVEAAGVPVVRMSQVHGADVAVVREVPGTPPTADALVTDVPGLALAVRAADCVPVLLADPATGVLGAVHAGRAGVAGGAVAAAVTTMRSLGAGDPVAWVGPHVCGRCYEVPADLHDEVVAAVPETRSTTRAGTPALDLGAGVRAQLDAAGCCEVVEVGACTLEDPAWPSHRRDGGRAERFAGVVWSTA